MLAGTSNQRILLGVATVTSVGCLRAGKNFHSSLLSRKVVKRSLPSYDLVGSWEFPDSLSMGK